MHDNGHVQGHSGTGPPSARARQQLSADLRRELADARVRLQEASLRAEAHRLLGDDVAAAGAVREQQALLGDLEHRLGRSVSAAVLQREAEHVVAAAEVPTVEPAPASPHRRPVLSGVASLVAALALASMAILGQAPGSVSVLDVSDDGDRRATEAPGAPSADPTVERESSANRPSSSPTTTTRDPGSRLGSTPADSRGTAGGGAADDGTTDPGTSGELQDLVTQLDAVVDRLDPVDVPAQLPPPPPAEEPSPEVPTNGAEPPPEDDEDGQDEDVSHSTVEQPAGAPAGQDTADDGFVPETAAQ